MADDAQAPAEGGQYGLDLGVEVERTAWGEWVDPARRAAAAQRFLRLAEIDRLPPTPWAPDSPEARRLNPIVEQLFPDLDTAMAPQNAEMADAFICFVGECFAAYAGGQWIDYEWPDREYSFYDAVNPALRLDTEDEDELTAWFVMESMIGYHREEHEGMFSELAATLNEYAADHEQTKRENSRTS
ncbi:hypothetical protein AB0H71_03085 [Nocardia sp. NPDC050697]|uniref:hypothetical protein n=1 Tax=Nocardia sp. NPDC050697 TaxID=3155158 RepID=UPI00340FACCF